MNLSDNFKRSENRCRCMECNQYGADIELVFVLETLRSHIRQEIKGDAIIVVNSWFRCRAHNNRSASQKNSYGIYGAGSNDNSWHLSGAAADIRVPDVSPRDIHEHLETMYPDKYGIGLYDTFIHIDVRPNKARWCS